jgi:transcriptional regulator with XRE-family HTH domain
VKYKKDQDFLKKVGLNIRFIRKTQGISQSQLSFESGIRINQIGRIERGEINTSLSAIYFISKALNVDPSELIKIKRSS